MKKTPLQVVNEKFGSKSALAEKLVAVLERPADEDQADFEKRIQTASNKQLLRLWNVEESVKSRFGGKPQLVDAIVTAKFGKDNADYRAKISRYAKSRLLDLHRQVAG